MTRLFAVRNRQSPEKFASPRGWAPFKEATIYEFTTDAASERFMLGMDDIRELVELVITPVRARN